MLEHHLYIRHHRSCAITKLNRTLISWCVIRVRAVDHFECSSDQALWIRGRIRRTCPFRARGSKIRAQPSSPLLRGEPRVNPEPYMNGMYIYIYIYIYTYTHTYTHTYIQTYIHIYKYVYVYMYIYIHIYTYIYPVLFVWGSEELGL